MQKWLINIDCYAQNSHEWGGEAEWENGEMWLQHQRHWQSISNSQNVTFDDYAYVKSVHKSDINFAWWN